MTKQDKAEDVAIKWQCLNKWFFLHYAPEFFEYTESKNESAGKAENPHWLANIIAHHLAEIVELRLKRNLNLSYEPRQEILRRVRGRIDILKTERRQLLQKAQIACRFEELTVDTPRNRFVRDALEKIASLVEENPKLSNKCRMQALNLRRSGVKGAAPDIKQMRNQRYGRNDKNDKKMVDMAIWAFELHLPDGKQSFDFIPPERDEEELHKLYEKAITNFYKKALPSEGWKVSSQVKKHWKSVGWKKYKDKDPEMVVSYIETKYNEETKKEETKKVKDKEVKETKFPAMKPDIILEKKDEGGGKTRTIVIDTKCKYIHQKNDENKGEHKFVSADIYQIYSYLSSQEGRDDCNWSKTNTAGLLLYPSTPKYKEDMTKANLERNKIEAVFDVNGFRVWFVAINFIHDIDKVSKKLEDIINKIENTDTTSLNPDNENQSDGS